MPTDTDKPVVLSFHALPEDDNSTARIHTCGLRQQDLPELEMRHVPVCLTRAAVSLLRDVLDHMLARRGTELELEIGDVLIMDDDPTVVTIIQATPRCGRWGDQNLVAVEQEHGPETWEVRGVDHPPRVIVLDDLED